MNHLTSPLPERLNAFLLKVGAENEDTGDETALLAQYNLLDCSKNTLQGLPLIRILQTWPSLIIDM